MTLEKGRLEDELIFVKGCVFDLDGMLIDSEGAQYEGWLPRLKAEGVELSIPEYQKVAGMRGDKMAEYFVEKFGLSISPEKLLESKMDILHELLEKKPIRKGAIPLLRYLHSQDFPIAIATGGDSEETGNKLEKHGLWPYVNSKIIITGDQVKNGKPNPETYELAAERLGITSEQETGLIPLIAFEDTIPGAQAAIGANYKRCVFSPTIYSQGDRADEFATKPRIKRIDSLKKIKTYCEENLILID